MSDYGWDTDPAPVPDEPADPAERRIHFWLAFAFTALVTFVAVAALLSEVTDPDDWSPMWTSLWIAIGVGVIGGFLAARFGRRFWEFVQTFRV